MINRKEKKRKKTKSLTAVMHVISVTGIIGFELAVMTVVGFYVGKQVDERFNTSPLFLIICLLLGLAAGIISVIKTIERLLAKKL
ncbi:AtpZ/AtpI family protein [Peptococcaceae bacterium]|nr:AtpZ/AtpI family protein [Peptococcaceae bacterium]MCL0107590.1 AtpZ/AtpI family protein [Peptococcaceae bacterium]